MPRANKIAILLLSVVLFFRLFGVFVVLPIFSLYALDLKNATPFLVGIAFGSYSITQAILQIPFGIFSDIFSRKKALILGLFLFGCGCLLSGFSDSIFFMIMGRLLQGCGAISSVIFAAVGDLVSADFRIRAMSFLGISAGLAFAVAFGSASFIANWLGLLGIFQLLGFLSFFTLILVLIYPMPGAKKSPKPAQRFFSFSELLNKSIMLPLACSFICSFGLAVFMFYFPLELTKLGVPRAELWQFYLPLLLLGLLTMPLAAVLAEKYNKLSLVFNGGIMFLLSGALFSFIIPTNLLSSYLLVVGCYLFFVGFNVFEPILPALVLKQAKDNNRGKASGTLALSQFAGSFNGAVCAGAFFADWWSMPFVLLSIATTALLFFKFYSFDKNG